MQITATFESIEEMKKFSAEMSGLADVAKKVITGPDKPKKPAVQTKADPEPKPEPESEASTAPWQEDAGKTESVKEEKSYTLEEVRAKLAALQKAGKRAEVKDILTSLGVSKLSELPADRYGELMEKAGEI